MIKCTEGKLTMIGAHEELAAEVMVVLSGFMEGMNRYGANLMEKVSALQSILEGMAVCGSDTWGDKEEECKLAFVLACLGATKSFTTEDGMNELNELRDKVYEMCNEEDSESEEDGLKQVSVYPKMSSGNGSLLKRAMRERSR